MEITHVSDEHASASDASLDGVAAAMLERQAPIRMRLPISLWDGKQYVAWRQEVWKLEVKDQAEALEFRAVMVTFFQTVYRCGLARTMAALIHEQGQLE